jgi:hypothetical protein
MKSIIKPGTNQNDISMNLSDDELTRISQLAGINTDIRAIARFLDINPDDFEAQYMMEGSPVRRAIDEGINNAECSIREKQLEAAKLGDTSAAAECKKDATHSRWQRHKDKLLFDKKVSDYQGLRAAIETGQGELPEHLKKYYEVLDFIRSLYNQFNSKSFIISMVRTKWPEISYGVATKLYYESLNFFYVDNGIKKEVWANIYADQLDTIANLAFESNQLDIAGKYKLEAAKMRGVGKEQAPQLPDELMDRRVILYTIKIADIGMKPANRRELAEQIDSYDIPEGDKRRLKNDAMIEDIPFELSLNNDEEEPTQTR